MAAQEMSHAELARDLTDIAERINRMRDTAANAIFPHTGRAIQRKLVKESFQILADDVDYWARVVKEAGLEYGDGKRAPAKKAEIKEAPAKAVTATKPTAKAKAKSAKSGEASKAKNGKGKAEAKPAAKGKAADKTVSEKVLGEERSAERKAQAQAQAKPAAKAVPAPPENGEASSAK